jgi:diguanylate cyclase (GGDEF)-like protein
VVENQPLRRDPLTGLPAWPIHQRLRAVISAQRGTHGRTGLVLLDLDDFGGLNDHLGYPGGDQLLVEVAHRISATVGPTDLVGRSGGNAFAVVMPGVAGSDEVRAMADRLLVAISRPWTWKDCQIVTSASAGVHVQAGGETVDDMVGQAMYALDVAKEIPRFGYRSFAARVPTAALHSGSINGLRQGLLQWASYMATWYPDDDLRTALAPFLDCARRLGHDPASALAQAAATGGPRLQEVFAAFARRTDVRLAAFGWSVVEMAGGPAYRHAWPGSSASRP